MHQTTSCATYWCLSTEVSAQGIAAACGVIWSGRRAISSPSNTWLLEGVNDSEQQARELAQLVRDVPCKFT